MKWLSALSSAAMLYAAVVGSANANTYDFTFSGTDVFGTGVITTGNGVSPLAITGVSGIIVDSDVGPGVFNITGLSPYAASDNLLFYPNQPFVTFGGVSFTTDTGGDFNIGYVPPYVVLSSILNPGGGLDGAFTQISFEVSQSPLPPAWTMMLIGLIGFGLVAKFNGRARTGLGSARSA
jgi:hypothetical protein